MVVGLEYMHNNGVIHRDIKPENLVMESNGYVRITDLGIARIWTPENSQDTSGTPGYMAPEVMYRQNHCCAVDYFALGVIGYEFMLGRRPYNGKSRKEIRDAIFAKQVQIKKHEIPDGWTIEAADFINKCLQRKPANRLGLNGPNEVKQHVWLKDFNWQALLEKKLAAPYLPEQNDDNFDAKQANGADPWKEENAELLRQNSLLLRRNSIQNLFSGYYYDLDLIRLQKEEERRYNKGDGPKSGMSLMPEKSLKPIKNPLKIASTAASSFVNTPTAKAIQQQS